MVQSSRPYLHCLAVIAIFTSANLGMVGCSKNGELAPASSAPSSMSQPTGEPSKPSQPAPSDDKKPDAAKLLVGKWVLTKTTYGTPEVPVGSTYEFTRDGTMTLDIPKLIKLDGTFKVDKDKITYRLEGENFDSIVTIGRLTEEILELKFEDKNTETLKRKN